MAIPLNLVIPTLSDKILKEGITKSHRIGWLFAFALTACGELYDCNDFESRIKSISANDESTTRFYLSSYNDFEWDEVYIIEGPRFPQEVEEIVGLGSFDKEISDDARLYVFLHKGILVLQSASYCHDLNYNTMGREGYLRYHRNEALKVRVDETEGGTFYSILGSTE